MPDPQAHTSDEIRAAFAAGYDIEREIHGGGMSRVYLATERALHRRVVIKVLPPDLAAGVNRERFRREVQLAAQLQHPHIVPLYAAGDQGDLLYYTMPFIEGESLRHALHAGTKFSPREVVSVLRDVVDALGYAHARGVIHRDIKPGNVLRSGSHAVVTDFGVAKAISASLPAVGMTTTGMAIGTPAYMAPEQLAGDPAADHRVDLYAAGLLAYELLTGVMPFAGGSPQETMAAQLTRVPEPLDTVRRDVPPALSAVIMRCLAKRPEARPQSAAELLAALDAVVLPTVGAGGRRNIGWVALAATAVVAGIVAAWPRPAPVTPTAPRDTVTVSPAGPLLTRAESLAIAKAVEARLAEQRVARRQADASRPVAAAAAVLPESAMRRMADSIRDEIQRAVFDSLARLQAAATSGARGAPPRTVDGRSERVFVQRGRDGGRFIGLAPELDSMIRAAESLGRSSRGTPVDSAALEKRAASMGPPRRLVITEPRVSSRTAASQALATAVADSLRHVLTAGKRFVAVDRDTVRFALDKTRTIDDLSQMLSSDRFASITLVPAGNDSVQVHVTLRDLSAHPAYGMRSSSSATSTARGPVPGLDSLLSRAARQLGAMDRAPRKTPAASTTVQRP